MRDTTIFGLETERLKRNNLLEEEFGKIEFNFKVYVLTQNAYLDEENGVPVYLASAVDNQDAMHTVRWEVVDNWNQLVDESDMCNWDSPVSVEKS